MLICVSLINRTWLSRFSRDLREVKSSACQGAQNSKVNTLNASALVNKMGGSFAKNGTIDYLCWAKRKMFLLASRNVSNCKYKPFYLQVEILPAADRKYVGQGEIQEPTTAQRSESNNQLA